MSSNLVTLAHFAIIKKILENFTPKTGGCNQKTCCIQWVLLKVHTPLSAHVPLSAHFYPKEHIYPKVLTFFGNDW